MQKHPIKFWAPLPGNQNQELGTEYDPDPERTLRKRLRAAKLARVAMGDERQPPRRTMGDY
ncbi:hypothetical protein A2U01_0094811, partial [Trifolium medium]|nr:hypothetical protein [Trifolium medium]